MNDDSLRIFIISGTLRKRYCARLCIRNKFRRTDSSPVASDLSFEDALFAVNNQNEILWSKYQFLLLCLCSSCINSPVITLLQVLPGENRSLKSPIGPNTTANFNKDSSEIRPDRSNFFNTPPYSSFFR